MKNQQREKRCEWCGIKFTPGPPNQIYCTKVCSGRYWNNRQTGTESKNKNCKQCGDEFRTTRSLQVYCSVECRVLYHWILKTKKYYRNKKVIILNLECKHCGEYFLSKAESRMIFCSKDCRSQHHIDKCVIEIVVAKQMLKKLKYLPEFESTVTAILIANKEKRHEESTSTKNAAR